MAILQENPWIIWTFSQANVAILSLRLAANLQHKNHLPKQHNENNEYKMTV
jgi:hypothetical protein